MADEQQREKCFKDVRDAKGRLLYRRDANRDIIQLKPPWSAHPVRVDWKTGEVIEDEAAQE